MKRIVLVANTSWSIYNFRYGLIKELLNKKYKVIIIAPYDKFSDKLKKLGCKVYDIEINSKGTNPLEDMNTMINFYKLYKKINPDLIFHYTIKPNIYGTIAAKFCNIPSIAITTGLGYAFINDNLITKIVSFLYKFSFKFTKEVWFLNEDDKNIFLQRNLVDVKKTFVLPSEGIDTQKFKPIQIDKKDNIFRFLLIARMLWDKGVGEYVEAAKIIKQKYKNVEFLLLGAIGVDNPTVISKKTMEEWEKEGIVKYLGTTDDVKNEIAKVDCIVLPSYREGTSRVLLESASMAKPIITTNVPGCKEVVDDGVNGYLCEVKNSKDLANKMEMMLNLSDDERIEMGRKGRQKIVNEFDEKIVINKYLETIEKILNS